MGSIVTSRIRGNQLAIAAPSGTGRSLDLGLAIQADGAGAIEPRIHPVAPGEPSFQRRFGGRGHQAP